MSRLIDLWGEAMRSRRVCRDCGWTGTGAQCASGEHFGDGLELDCPLCGGRCGFAQYSIVTGDGDLSKVERAPD